MDRYLYGPLTRLIVEARLQRIDISAGCIDKTSSAELSEAINSMFTWYENAAACFVYLNDVFVHDVDQDQRQEFIESSWFLRGWTLQELLAPKHLVFCNARWAILGCRNMPEHSPHFEKFYGPSLIDTVAYTTGIRRAYLRGGAASALNQASIGERLSWAAKRKTTRKEDEAYCLLGILQLNMPLLYGEKEKAFFRLQQAVMQQSTDKSLFAWTLPTGSGTSCEGMLAPSPKAFAMSLGFDIPCYADGSVTTLNSRGLHLRGRAVKVPAEEFNQHVRSVGGRSVVEVKSDVYFLRFRDTSPGFPRQSLIVALAKRFDDQFQRVCIDDIGQKFDQLFALTTRKREAMQSFYIDV